MLIPSVIYNGRCVFRLGNEDHLLRGYSSDVMSFLSEMLDVDSQTTSHQYVRAGEQTYEIFLTTNSTWHIKMKHIRTCSDWSSSNEEAPVWSLPSMKAFLCLALEGDERATSTICTVQGCPECCRVEAFADSSEAGEVQLARCFTLI